MENKNFYITTPIYYPSDKLHIGHALTTTMCDTLARYKKMRDYDVFFLTGSDEHGQKIERKAKEKGVTPQEYVDIIVASFQELWSKLDIEYDDFLRTTQKRHHKVVQELFKKVYAKGDIYKSEYEGWYCTPCETFFTDRQLVDGKCPDCGRKVELVKEESYFFKMSKYADRLLKYIEDNPNFIQPNTRKNEMVSFIKQGLEDLCISRTTFDWGIPVPIDSKHVIYVWFDALTNYISALGYGTDDDSKFNKYWSNTVHMMAKDIIRFHSIIWPTILMAADIELPKVVFAHGWLLLDGDKMSKSKGNVVDPIELIEKYGSDAIRYFLLREMPYGADGYYSEDALILRSNTDLANDYGNLLSRTTQMINKFCEGNIPEPKGQDDNLDIELKEIAAKLPQEVDDALNNFKFGVALEAIWKLVNKANKYIELSTPWALAKDPEKAERLNTVMYNLVEAIRISTILITPFMPKTPAKVWEQLGLSDNLEVQNWKSLEWGSCPNGVKINRGEPIFPRIDVKKGNQEEEKKVSQKKEVKEKVKNEKANEENANVVELIKIDDFAKVDLRVAEIMEAEKVENADKLLKLQIRVGEEERIIVAGIALHYSTEELIGKKIVIVANLKPAKLRGILSQGMILAASQDGKLGVLTIDKDIPSGAKVK